MEPYWLGAALALAFVLVVVFLLFRPKRVQASKDHHLGARENATRGSGLLLGGRKRDIVAAAVVAPRAVSSSASFRVWVSISKEKQLAGIVKARAEQLGAVAAPAQTLSERIRRGALLDIVLTGPTLAAPLIVKCRWEGRPLEASFQLKLDERHTEKRALFDVAIFSDNLCLGVIPLTIGVEATAAASAAQDASLSVPRRVFLSYSSPDRGLALEITRAYRRIGVDTFMDRLSLEGGELWEERLGAELDRCDAVYLLWSKASAGSEWVRWEIRRALDRRRADPKRLPVIITHIVGGPPPVEPPEDLKALQFNDPALALWEYEVQKARSEEAQRSSHAEG